MLQAFGPLLLSLELNAHPRLNLSGQEEAQQAIAKPEMCTNAVGDDLSLEFLTELCSGVDVSQFSSEPSGLLELVPTLISEGFKKPQHTERIVGFSLKILRVPLSHLSTLPFLSFPLLSRGHFPALSLLHSLCILFSLCTPFLFSISLYKTSMLSGPLSLPLFRLLVFVHCSSLVDFYVVL